jgi:uncharacterized protein (TIGR02145 family)
MLKPLFSFVILILIVSCNTSTNQSETSNLESITICNQIWSAQNLSVSKYQNGDEIPQIKDDIQWQNLTTGAWCWYNNDSTNNGVYGKLYNWYAVNDPRGLAPTGWHIPNESEWGELINCNGGQAFAGGALKEAGLAHWIAPNLGATNNSGFGAVPAGIRHNNCMQDPGNFYGLGTFAWFVGIGQDSTGNVPAFHSMTNGSNETCGPLCFGIWNCLENRTGVSVRCVKD